MKNDNQLQQFFVMLCLNIQCLLCLQVFKKEKFIYFRHLNQLRGLLLNEKVRQRAYTILTPNNKWKTHLKIHSTIAINPIIPPTLATHYY